MVIVYFIATPPLTELLKLETALFIHFCITRTWACPEEVLNKCWLADCLAGWMAGWIDLRVPDSIV